GSRSCSRTGLICTFTRISSTCRTTPTRIGTTEPGSPAPAVQMTDGSAVPSRLSQTSPASYACGLETTQDGNVAMSRTRVVCISTLVVVASTAALLSYEQIANTPGQRMALAAGQFLEALDENQRQQVR